MGPIQFISRGFIDFFGITHPTPKQERQAAWFIIGLLALIILFATATFLAIVFAFGRS